MNFDFVYPGGQERGRLLRMASEEEEEEEEGGRELPGDGEGTKTFLIGKFL